MELGSGHLFGVGSLSLPAWRRKKPFICSYLADAAPHRAYTGED
jgi:hypothetical protein